jgi:hypothetical protein
MYCLYTAVHLRVPVEGYLEDLKDLEDLEEQRNLPI